MNTYFIVIAGWMLTFATGISAQELVIDPQYSLIAHRGGVVDASTPENSMIALKKAIERGYSRIEIDVRLSKDSILVTNHDLNLVRYYGTDKMVSELTFNELKKLRGTLDQRVYSLEEILQACVGKIEVMIDLKIPGNDRKVHQSLIDLLKKYRLLEHAMMIGTDDSSDFYRTKIALSCTRDQLNANVKRPDFDPRHYYLFAGKLTADDLEFCKKYRIPVVGVINGQPKTDQEREDSRTLAEQLIKLGVRSFQIDSIFDVYFVEDIPGVPTLEK